MGKGDTSRAEIIQRISVIQELLLQGYTTADVRTFVHNQTVWKINDRTITRYIKRATDNYEAEVRSNDTKALTKAVARLEQLFRKNVEVKTPMGEEAKPNERFALEVLKELHKVQRLYEQRITAPSEGKDLVLNVNFVGTENEH